MIRHLHIENYALIEHLDMDFHSGFSVITGETGAGKSIIIGAIGLLLGQRADSRSIKTDAKRCVVEATFDLAHEALDDFFQENDLDFDGAECIIRRELTSTGKSRAFINDTPASLMIVIPKWSMTIVIIAIFFKAAAEKNFLFIHVHPGIVYVVVTLPPVENISLKF